MNKQDKRIREICTYHSDDGTSGYSLSEKQFEELFDFIHHLQEEARREIIKEVNDYLIYKVPTKVVDGLLQSLEETE